ncbi:Chelonianin [Platysternon megacephalum]|uniref:Chelonianin n=1 Tax=Platysternon megacephalum TaxID=55544 RepID=A0A4D9E0E5_9SAUR|nr:Chelonianin [Platysternon megacephalum]
MERLPQFHLMLPDIFTEPTLVCSSQIPLCPSPPQPLVTHSLRLVSVRGLTQQTCDTQSKGQHSGSWWGEIQCFGNGRVLQFSGLGLPFETGSNSPKLQPL